MAVKAKIRALQFVQQQLVRPLLRKNYVLREYELCSVLIKGIEPLNKKIANGKELFAIIDRISPKLIINSDELINPVRDHEGYYVSFDNDIEWVVSPKVKKQIGL